MKSSNVIQLVNVALLSFALGACGGGSTSSDIDNDINTADKNKSSTFQFVNATQDDVNFYIKYSTSSDSIYSSEYMTSSLLGFETSESYYYRWNDKLSATHIAFENANIPSEHKRINFTVENEQPYLAVAWQQDHSYALTILDKIAPTTNSAYSIRFFSAKDQQIFLNQNVNSTLFAEKGLVSNSISIENCDEISAVNDMAVNFCQVANIGERYLIILSETNQVMIVQE